jgi:flagellar secretion chaperone FliS
MLHARRYAQASIETASKERIMVLLFETALRRIRDGAVALESGRPHEAAAPLTRATDIVVELHATFDRARAPELGEKLGLIYRFVCSRLTEAKLQGDARLAREAERVFMPIVDGFATAVASLASGAAR